MDYQQLPAPPNMGMVGNGNGPPNNAPHMQLMQNQQMNNLQILTSMQPPPPPVNNNMPLQVLHSLPHIGNPNNNNNNNNMQNNNLHNPQSLLPPNQLPPLHHHNTNNNNAAVANNNNNNNHHPNAEEGNRWTQFQVQQLWRHHAYLNGNLFCSIYYFSLVLGGLFLGEVEGLVFQVIRHLLVEIPRNLVIIWPAIARITLVFWTP